MAEIVTTSRSARAFIGNGWISVRRLGEDWEGRTQYRWTVNYATGRAEGTDLHTGVGMDRGSLDMLGTLAAFLTACAESGEDGENSDLFPPDVRDWAEQYADELSILSYDIEHPRG